MNALDRRHPSQRRYYRNVRNAMVAAVAAHAAIFAFAPITMPPPLRGPVDGLRMVESSSGPPAHTLRESGEAAGGVPARSSVAEPARLMADGSVVTEPAFLEPASPDVAVAPARGGAAPAGTGGSQGLADAEPSVFYAYDTPPRVLRRVEPAYPTEARAAGMEGSVVVNLNIDARGRILRAWVAQANAADPLVEAALDAAYQFEFAPGTWRGEPVRCTVAIPFQFHLRKTTEVVGDP